MLCLLAAAAGAWLAVLNALVVAAASSVALAFEAALLGLTGVVISAVALRAARRAWRRRAESGRAPTRDAPPSDDPMAWVRRRKFGAGS